MTASGSPNAEMPAGQHFADRLAAAVRGRGNPVVVGLDPRYDRLPEGLRGASSAPSFAEQAAACLTFCGGVIDAVAGLVPAVKPQAAFFEQLGPEGMAALARVIDHAIAQGLLVILDGKRNDIGSTAAAYAEAYLGRQSAWKADALTVNPYLGDDSLQPFIDVGARRGAGIFVLVKTSNPGGKRFQDLVADGRSVYRHVGDHVQCLARETAGQCGYGLAGAVVGATYPDQAVELRAAMPNTWFLVPGYGSQGATARDVSGAFDDRGLGAIVNNSRGIIFAHLRREYAGKFGASRWQQAVEAATRDMIAELAAETPAGRLAPI